MAQKCRYFIVCSKVVLSPTSKVMLKDLLLFPFEYISQATMGLVSVWMGDLYPTAARDVAGWPTGQCWPNRELSNVMWYLADHTTRKQ